MTSQFSSPQPAPIIFDGWRSISISLFMALVGYSVMVSVPVLSSAMVAKLGFTEEQVGRVWGADLGGMSLGSVLAAFLVARVNRRMLVLAGVILSVGGNALCMGMAEYDPVLWLRVATGVGSGIFTAIAVVTLGGTSNPVRAFNMLLFAFAFSTALELHVLPMLTMDGIYLFFIGLAVACLLFLKWVPARHLNAEELARQEKIEEDKDENWHLPRIFPVFCLTAVCFTYINIGGYYTYIELAAFSDGVTAEWTGPVLTWSSIFAIVGCGIALVCARFGMFRPLFAGLIAMAASVMMVSGGITKYNFMVSIFAFMTLWTFADVYQSAMLAHMDRKGSMVALLPSVQALGQSIGPNIAASVIAAGLGYSVMFLVSGSMALVAMAIYMGISAYMHKHRSV